ncbi:acyltransferase family protein [Streptomyces sp. NPDC101166]|uniref:acyltransferase family protein n=1 Tax=Streptomyces sp. NPDC101166 TaxID=3366120 RepID=UPI00381AC6C8
MPLPLALRRSLPGWSHGTVAELLAGRDNSLGFLRLALATAVIVSHARTLGYGGKEYLFAFSGGQATLGNLAVYGFFVLSGLLVARSGLRLSVRRFLWHRALRILPGFWVCLALTAFVLAPSLHWYAYRTLDGLGGPDGPFGYLQDNWAVATRRYDISGFMVHERALGIVHAPAFNGSLWTLRHETLCYLGVAVLAVTGVLGRARRVVVLITFLLGWLVVRQAIATPFWPGAVAARFFRIMYLPLVGGVTPGWISYLGFAFCLGMLVELCKERVPVSDPLALAAGAVVLGSLRHGYFYVVGLPAYAYLLLWLAVRLPGGFRRVGARDDYSYGIYIYGFPVQQTLVVLGYARFGMPLYLLLSMSFTLILAVASWHLVERPALRLKDFGKRPPGPLPRALSPQGGTSPPGPCPPPRQSVPSSRVIGRHLAKDRTGT